MNDLELWENIKKSVKPLVKHQVVKQITKSYINVKKDYGFPYIIDLHGYTVHNAYLTLIDFIVYHYHKKSKYVTVITGKGTPEKESFIHSEIKTWLNSKVFKKYIKNFEWINGNGALRIYVSRHNK